MTQNELDYLFQVIERDYTDYHKEFEALIEQLGGVQYGEFDYGGDDADVGGTYGMEQLADLLRQHNFTVLEDPAAESAGNQGWIIFPPKV